MSEEEQWEEITDAQHMLRPGFDQIRRRHYDAVKHEWGEWCEWGFVLVKRTVEEAMAGFLSHSFEFRRPRQSAETAPVQSEPQQPANVDRGERYQRRIFQSIDGPGKGESIVVDLADVFNAFNVPYMLGQAVKKSIIPGDRGAKDRLRDLREAAWHIQRQIQIEEAKGNGTV